MVGNTKSVCILILAVYGSNWGLSVVFLMPETD